jgi:hypothetical protein
MKPLLSDVTFEGLALRSPTAAATYRSPNYFAQVLRLNLPSISDSHRLRVSDISSANKTAAALQDCRKRIDTLERENLALRSRISLVRICLLGDVQSFLCYNKFI